MEKKIYFLLLVLLLGISVYAQQLSAPCTFVFSGKVIGQDTGFVYLSYMDKNDHYVCDSCTLKNGIFRFQGLICEPTHAGFRGRIKSRSTSDPNFTDLFLEPATMNGVFRVNAFKHGEITHSKTQQEYKELVRKRNKVNIYRDSVRRAYEKAKRNNEIDKVQKLKDELARYRSAHYKVYYDFIKTHPNSYVSAHFLRMLQGGHLTTESVRKFYSRLSPKVQKSRDGKFIMETIQRSEAVSIGKTAPDFVQDDINGHPVSLNSFRGKYILLDFWASWCIPCRKENPYLVKAYSRYKNQNFTIISVSLDSDKEKWEEAVRRDSLCWIQLSDLKGGRNTVAQKYNVRPIPDNFLIDPEGKIIAKDLRGKEIIKKLNSIFMK